MARKADPARIYAARRAAVESNLTTSGLTQDQADRWLALWEASGELGGLDVNARDHWQAGQEWIKTERTEGRRVR
jgi:hypothetical protein